MPTYTKECYQKALDSLRDDGVGAVPVKVLETALEQAIMRHIPTKNDRSAATYTLTNTALRVWNERDRAYVGLLDRVIDAVLYEWRDDAVRAAVEDGFLVPGKLHTSALEYFLTLEGA